MSATIADAVAIREAITETLLHPSSHHILHYTPTHAADDPILHACFSLIEETSSSAYAASSKGWRPKAKRLEMREKGMQYLLILPNPTLGPAPQSPPAVEPQELAKNLFGFLSFMLTIDDGVPVTYIYEIHLCSAVRGQGLGKTLMECVDAIGRRTGMQKAMLTVFVSNVAAIGFYDGLGYEKWDEEYIPPRKRLRSARKVGEEGEDIREPSYIIMAKDLLDVQSNGQDKLKAQSVTPDSDGWETDD
jgi:ribosomal protein S18 acetylase RimI-like enzyme